MFFFARLGFAKTRSVRLRRPLRAGRILSFGSAAPLGLISLEETLMNSIIYLVGLVVVVLFVLSLLGLR